MLFSVASARAAILVSLDHISSSSSSFDWVYDVRLEPGEFLTKGNFFTVYDFKGLENATWTPDSGPAVTGRTWDTTTQGTGNTPALVVPVDSAGISNVTVTLKDGENIVPNPQQPSVLLGQLTLTTETDVVGPRINFTSLSKQQGLATDEFTIGTVSGPVPEPATVSILGLGLLAATAVGLRRRKG